MNWKVRIKNKTFWLTFIPAILLLIKSVLALFGIEWNYDLLNEQLSDIVDALFLALATLGVVVDHTTSGVTDSEQAMTYETPKE